MNQILSQIITTTYTKSELIRRLRLVRDFVSFRLFDLNDADQTLPLDQQIDKFLATYKSNTLLADVIKRETDWLKSLSQQFYSQFTSHTMDTLFAEFEGDLAKIEPVILYLPIELPETDLERVGAWFKTQVGTEQIYETRFDADLIAGCALSLGGVYKDYSVRSRINQNKAAILENLKSFKKT